MAVNYNITVYFQRSLYDSQNRTLDVYFSEPEAGINEDTGILLISAGYGGEANSNVFCKMREHFADQYNYVTVQCNYFGWEYMQNPSLEQIQITISDLCEAMPVEQAKTVFLNYERNKEQLRGKVIRTDISMDESLSCMNDMGPVQAMDQLIATKVVSDILEQNHYKVNKKRIHAYGFSHGAYLNYLSNIYMPGVFTCLFDNSAYLLPSYLDCARIVPVRIEGIYTVKVIYTYLIHKIIMDKQIYDLSFLYQRIRNYAQVLSFHGVTDNMTSAEEKKQFLNRIPESELVVITDQKVDGEIFRSTTHGLNADFLKLFDYATNMRTQKDVAEGLKFSEQEIQTDDYSYHIELVDGVPNMRYEERKKDSINPRNEGATG